MTRGTLFYIVDKEEEEGRRKGVFSVYDSKMKKKDPEAQYRDIH